MDPFIFKEFFIQNLELKDRKTLKGEPGVDVIIPVIDTNPLWERNLYNFYERIPIERLLIGDGGSKDKTISIVKKFPRVEIIQQSDYRSLGYCIKDLISKVKTDWFIYLHADVFLPDNWYESMVKYKKEYDWFECSRVMSVLFSYVAESDNRSERAYSGSQLGRTEVFKKFLNKIDDDFLYRNEDIVFAELVSEHGGSYGRIFDTFHYHQVMNKEGASEPKIESVKIAKELDLQWEQKMLDMQIKGIIKYLHPKPYLVKIVSAILTRLEEAHNLNWKELNEWIHRTNPIWSNHFDSKMRFRIKSKIQLKAVIKKMRTIF